MRKPGGSALWTHPDGTTTECDTFSCVHCNKVVFVKSKSDLGGFCIQCFRHICGPCADIGTCTPLLKKIEECEDRDRLRKSILG